MNLSKLLSDNKLHHLIFKITPLIVCVTYKIVWSNYLILIICIDDILLATNDLDILCKTKDFLSKNFEIKKHQNALNFLKQKYFLVYHKIC